MSLEYRLKLSDAQYSQFTASSENNDLPFIRSYVQAQQYPAKVAQSSKEAQLHRRTYLLLRRLVLSTQLAAEVIPSVVADCMIDGGYSFRSLGGWLGFLTTVSEKFPKQWSAGFELWKSRSTKVFEAPSKDSDSIRSLQNANSLLQICAEAGTKLMTGSDYLESVIEMYRRRSGTSGSQEHQQLVVEHLYLSMRNLMSDKARHPSLLLDQLYVLRADADRLGKKKIEVKSLLAAVLCTTGFLRHLAGDPAVIDTKRGQDMLDALLAYREQTRHLFPAPLRPRRKLEKGKGKDDHNEEMHIHQAAMVSQIHELFPDLSGHYIMRLLDHFTDDVEQTTAALLEPGSLPPTLRDPNAEIEEVKPMPKHAQPKPIQSSIPERKNVFDNDDFDKLKISSKQLHQGQRKISITEPELPDEKNKSKAAILAALSALDESEDERDDTYDLADVGGSVDQSVDTDSRKSEQNPHEEVLYKAWKDSTALFARDSKTRMSPVRQDLKRQTGMSDEQIEGWAIMLSRDPALQRRLQQRYSVTNTFRGNQSRLQPTSWQQATSEENSMDESDDRKRDTGDESGMSEDISRSNSTTGRGRGRGRGGGRGDFGGSGNTSEGSSTSERARGRGRGRGGRANHNRREGRARKMNRGMAGAPAP